MSAMTVSVLSAIPGVVSEVIRIVFRFLLLMLCTLYLLKGVFKGGFRGFKPLPEIFRFFLKSEGKEVERKRKKRWGRVIVNIFLGVDIFLVGLRNF